MNGVKSSLKSFERVTVRRLQNRRFLFWDQYSKRTGGNQTVPVAAAASCTGGLRSAFGVLQTITLIIERSVTATQYLHSGGKMSYSNSHFLLAAATWAL